MEIAVSKSLLKMLPQYKKDKPAWEIRFQNDYRYNSDESLFEMDIERFADEELEALYKAAHGSTEKELRGLVKKISLFRNIQKDPLGAPVNKLQSLLTAGKSVIGKTDRRWLFRETFDGDVIPYYVQQIRYYEYDARSGRAAYVEFSLEFTLRGEAKKRRLDFHSTDLNGSTVVQLLAAKGYSLETKALIDNYLQEVEVYKKLHTRTGSQFLASGEAEISESRHYNSGIVSMDRDGEKSKVVMDDLDDEEEDGGSRSSSRRHNTHAASVEFWEDKKKKTSEDDDCEESVIVPLHPYIKVFDLTKHRYVITHINNLEEYKYDTKLSEKLILPKNKKDLVDILVQGANNLMDDIVKGKTGGIIVLATGEPGTGKTLTAEVYAETVKKPLYVVQCSQLGTDEETLEKKLTQVLYRSSRWGAILLIDEADVYIYERGRDIRQNAIVGVFLRVLEYYQGVLFLTSNRATIIDDAIISRVTAHIRYEIPSQEESVKIWTVLANQFKIKLDDQPAVYAKAFPKVSGRTIKGLLKLSRLLAEREKKTFDVALVKYASEFLDGVVKEA